MDNYNSIIINLRRAILFDVPVLYTMQCATMWAEGRFVYIFYNSHVIQKSPAVADKPTRRESMPKIAQIRRAYNVVADNTGLYSYV